MTWWTEPDPEREAGSRSRAHSDPVTNRNPVRFEAVPDAHTKVLPAHDAEAVTVSHEAIPATVTLDSAAPHTRILPTALVPRSEPRGNDAPTLSLQAVRQARTFNDAATPPPAFPLDPAFGPLSPDEIKQSRPRRARKLSIFGWFRLVLGVPTLIAGTASLAAGLAPAATALGDVWNPATGIGAALVTLGWILVPGSAVGASMAVLLSLIAWATAWIGFAFLQLPNVQATIGAAATSTIVNWVLPSIVFVAVGAAWLIRRNKHPSAVVVLAIPLALIIATGFVVPDGWLYGTTPQSMWSAFTTFATAVITPWFAGWPELATNLAAGIDGLLKLSAAMLPLMLLAWPLQRRR